MLGRNSNPKSGFDLITCQIRGRFTTTQPSHPHIASGYISRTAQIGVDCMYTPVTPKEPCVSGGLSIMASVTLLTRIRGINTDHPDPVLACLVLQKGLEFPECPFVVPCIIFGCFSNPAQVLHDQDIPLGKGINDLFGDIVVYPSHKPFPSVPRSLEFTSGCRCAFGLEFCHKLLPPDPFAFDTPEEGGVTGHCQRVDSEINTQDFTAVVTNLGVHLFGEREAEEKASFEILDQGAFSDIPIKVFLKTFGDFNGELDPSIRSREGENRPIISNGGTPGEVVSNRKDFRNLWFGFCSLDHLQRLFDGITSKLRVELEVFSDFCIAKFVESVSMLDFVLPCHVNTKLDGFGKDPHCFTKDVRKISEFNFRSNNGFHTTKLEQRLGLKTFSQFLPHFTVWVSLM